MRMRLTKLFERPINAANCVAVMRWVLRYSVSVMNESMRKTQLPVKPWVAFYLNDEAPNQAYGICVMARPSKPQFSNAEYRFHYIPEWAAHRNMRQSDIMRAVGVDKSTVFRWFEGTIPAEKHLISLSSLFSCEIESLFRHPDDDWLVEFFRTQTDLKDAFRGRDSDELARMRQLLNLTFPKKVA